VSIVAIGCNHRSTPLSILEQLTVPAENLPKALAELSSAHHLSEVVVLSTCNRIEIYALAERYHGGYQDIREFLSLHSGLPPEIVADHIYAHHDEEAVRHLFSVAGGLDSAVLGEHEILGQVRTAWERARDEGTVGSILGPLFRHALETGKRARTETAIARGIASVSQAAVAMAGDHTDGLVGSTVLVVGAGEMGEGTVKNLAKAGAAEVLVANRTWERAEKLAAACGGRAVPLAELADALVKVDLMVTTTGAQDLILEASQVDTLVERRGDHSLVIVDVAVPRDVDPAVREIPGVTLLDMDDIGAFVDEQCVGRTRAVSNVTAIVDDEVDRYRSITSAREVAPLVSDLRRKAEDVRQEEMHRYAAKLADLDSREREAVESITKGMINKLLHEPTVRLKDAAGHARGERLADSLRDLFDL